MMWCLGEAYVGLVTSVTFCWTEWFCRALSPVLLSRGAEIHPSPSDASVLGHFHVLQNHLVNEVAGLCKAASPAKATCWM